MNDQHYSEKQILTFIETKDFNALTEEEKAHVLTVCTEDAYTELRKTVDAVGSAYSNDFDAHVFNDDAIKTKLDEQFAKKHGSSNVRKLLHYNIPAWQAAALLIGCLLTGTLYMETTTHIHMQRSMLTAFTDTVYVQQPAAIIRDTVYVVKTIKEKFIVAPKTEVAIADTLSKRIPVPYFSSGNPGDIHIAGFTDQPQGQTLQEDTMSEKFMVRML